MIYKIKTQSLNSFLGNNNTDDRGRRSVIGDDEIVMPYKPEMPIGDDTQILFEVNDHTSFIHQRVTLSLLYNAKVYDAISMILIRIKTEVSIT